MTLVTGLFARPRAQRVSDTSAPRRGWRLVCGGACPVCGHDVERTHAFNGVRLLDSYACRRCGPTDYFVAVS